MSINITKGNTHRIRIALTRYGEPMAVSLSSNVVVSVVKELMNSVVILERTLSATEEGVIETVVPAVLKAGSYSLVVTGHLEGEGDWRMSAAAGIVITTDTQEGGESLTMYSDSFDVTASVTVMQGISGSEEELRERIAGIIEEEYNASEQIREQNETARIVAERTRQSAEEGRVDAEQARMNAETARVDAEQQRVMTANNDHTRASNDHDTATRDHTQATQDHSTASTDHNNAVNDHTTAESDRTRAEGDHATATNDHTQASTDHTRAEADHKQADSDHATAGVDHGQSVSDSTRASQDHEQAVQDHGQVNALISRADDDHARAESDYNRAAQDHQTATSDHSQAGQDHTRAESDHNTASADHSTATNDHTVADQDHATASTDHSTASADHAHAEQDHETASADHTRAISNHIQAVSDHAQAGEDHAQYLEDHASIADKVSVQQLKIGTVVPKFADNLASWHSSRYSVDVEQKAVVGTTGGSESVDSSVDARLLSVVPKTDFSAASLIATGFNWLRFATAVGNGWAILVPALPYGAINTATAPNGMLFTDEGGVNLRPTVYIKPIEEDMPESVTDGTACPYTDKDGYRFYNTAQPCWMVVSGIDRSATCAHIGWSGRYDEYKAIDDVTDAGVTLALLAAITSMHNNGKMLVVGNIADRIDYADDTHATLTVSNGRVQPSWVNILQEDGETYLHTANISDMKSGGMAEFETASIALTVSGTTVSYSDGNATASTDYVKYVKNVPVRTTYALDTRFAVEDYGGLILQSATGVAEVTIRYAQGIPDNLRALSPKVQAILQMLDDTNVLVERNTYEVPCEAEFDAMPLLGGQPMVLFCAGAPTAENKPTNWIGVEDGGYEWTGLPNVIGQHVRDITNGADYYGWQNPNTLLLEWK